MEDIDKDTDLSDKLGRAMEILRGPKPKNEN